MRRERAPRATPLPTVERDGEREAVEADVRDGRPRQLGCAGERMRGVGQQAEDGSRARSDHAADDEGAEERDPEGRAARNPIEDKPPAKASYDRWTCRRSCA